LQRPFSSEIQVFEMTYTVAYTLAHATAAQSDEIRRLNRAAIEMYAYWPKLYGHWNACGSPTVAVADLRSRLPRTKQRIFDAVCRRPGIDAEALCDAIWADDIDGGPLSGRKNVHVHVHQLNKLIAPHGIAVRATRWSGYRIAALRPP
jgi:hypothetical protein